MSEKIKIDFFQTKNSKKPNLIVKIEADDYGSNWSTEIERKVIRTIYEETQRAFARTEIEIE